jgi:hypothetical protein
MKTVVIQLFGFFHTFHEPGKFLKLCSLIVDGPQRRVDFNGFLKGRHVSLLYVISREPMGIDL